MRSFTPKSVFQFLEDSDTSLLLSLNHPQPAVRVLALQHLKDVIETSKVCVLNLPLTELT